MSGYGYGRVRASWGDPDPDAPVISFLNPTTQVYGPMVLAPDGAVLHVSPDGTAQLINASEMDDDS